MDKRTSKLRKQRLQQKRVAPILLFLTVAILSYWLSFRVFTSIGCDFSGSKVALVIVPACLALGNKGAAAIPFLLACASFFMAIQSYRQLRNLTLHSSGTAQKRAAP
jgi:hypothetical protein